MLGATLVTEMELGCLQDDLQCWVKALVNEIPETQLDCLQDDLQC